MEEQLSSPLSYMEVKEKEEVSSHANYFIVNFEDQDIFIKRYLAQHLITTMHQEAISKTLFDRLLHYAGLMFQYQCFWLS